MPWKMWQNSCCEPGVWHGSQKRCSCSSDVEQRSQWMLTTDERKLRYQLHCGLAPIGAHRKLADDLLAAATTSCSRCRGEGLLGSPDMVSWNVCPTCRGYGRLPLPNCAFHPS